MDPQSSAMLHGFGAMSDAMIPPQNQAYPQANFSVQFGGPQTGYPQQYPPQQAFPQQQYVQQPFAQPQPSFGQVSVSVEVGKIHL
jgi:hypothetical protein